MNILSEVKSIRLDSVDKPTRNCGYYCEIQIDI